MYINKFIHYININVFIYEEIIATSMCQQQKGKQLAEIFTRHIHT